MLQKKFLVAFVTTGIACLALFLFFVSSPLDRSPDSQEFSGEPRITKDQALAAADSFVKSLSIDFDLRDYYSRDIQYNGNNDTVLYLLDRNPPERVRELLKEWAIPYGSWSFTWENLDEYTLSVSVDSQTGAVTRYEYAYLPGSNGSPLRQLDEELARQEAEQFLERQNIELPLFTAAEVEQKDKNGVVFYEFKWKQEAKALGEAQVVLRVVVAADTITVFSRSLELPKTFLRGYRRSLAASEFWLNLSLTFYLLFGCVLLGFAFARRKSLDWRMGRRWAAAASVVFTLYFFNGQVNYVAYIDVLIKLLSVLLYSSLMVVIVPVTQQLFKEGLNKELFSCRDRTSAAESVIIGYVLSFLLLLLVSFYYFLMEHLHLLRDVGIGDTVGEILTSRFLFLAPFLIGIIPALMEELFRVFIIALGAKVTRNIHVAIIISAFVWGFGHVSVDGSLFPGYMSGVEKFLSGILLGYLVVRLGIVTLMVWHFLNNFIVTTIVLADITPQLKPYSLALMALLIVPLWLALYVRFKGDRLRAS